MRLLRRSQVLLASLTTACVAVPPPVVAPIAPHALPVGLVDGFHGLLSAEQFARDCPAMIRTPQLSGSALRAFLDASPCPVLALVEAPDVALVDAFARARPAAIELGNELELPPYELTPDQYAEWIDRAVRVLVEAKYFGRIVLGGVYAITPETKQAVALGLRRCSLYQVPCIVGVHLYDASDADLAWLRSLHARIWVTETGAHDNCDPAKGQAKTPWLKSQIARFSTVPMLERVFVYQRARGADCSDFSTFGIEGQPALDLLHP